MMCVYVTMETICGTSLENNSVSSVHAPKSYQTHKM